VGTDAPADYCGCSLGVGGWDSERFREDCCCRCVLIFLFSSLRQALKLLCIDSTINKKSSLLPTIHLAVLSLRLLLLIALSLFQLPFLYQGIYLPNPELATGERTSLLSGAAQNGYSAIPTKQPSPLKATNPPPKRPDVDNQSLSILTLFKRVKVRYSSLSCSFATTLTLPVNSSRSFSPTFGHQASFSKVSPSSVSA
jgi:hypothetical protein